MRENDQIHAQLVSHMEQALKACLMLQDFSEEKMSTFSDGSDQEIIQLIQDRERIINILISLEYKIDLILDAVDEYAYGDDLPSEIDQIRQAIRKVLSGVTELDMKAMHLVGGRVQKYKDETLKARNLKHLSAYIKNVPGNKPHGGYNGRN